MYYNLIILVAKVSPGLLLTTLLQIGVHERSGNKWLTEKNWA